MTDSMTVHHTVERGADTTLPDTHQDTFSKNILGFWVYLMTDCILFATLFIAYAVLHNNTFGGPTVRELFHLTVPFTETMILLSSSLTCGLAVLAAIAGKNRALIGWLVVTLLLGALFVFIEFYEFSILISEGNSWQRSAFLSSFFTLVGTHGLHIGVGVLWAIVLVGQLLVQGINTDTFRRVIIFSFFWHFLELIWIFVFTLIYLIGGV